MRREETSDGRDDAETKTAEIIKRIIVRMCNEEKIIMERTVIVMQGKIQDR